MTRSDKGKTRKPYRKQKIRRTIQQTLDNYMIGWPRNPKFDIKQFYMAEREYFDDREALIKRGKTIPSGATFLRSRYETVGEFIERMCISFMRTHTLDINNYRTLLASAEFTAEQTVDVPQTATLWDRLMNLETLRIPLYSRSSLPVSADILLQELTPTFGRDPKVYHEASERYLYLAITPIDLADPKIKDFNYLASVPTEET